MALKGFFIIVAFVALSLASEIEDSEQKKRGAGKPNALNSIPTGAQKSEYSYNLYPQSSQSSPNQAYQSQVPNSFYPSQSASQYYATANSEGSSPHSQGTQSQFVPINFVPTPGYQSKYQIIAQKPNAIQLAVIQQPTIQPSSMLQYTNSIFSPNPANPLLGSLGHGQFSFGPSFHPLSLGGHFISQPSAMVVLPQHHSPLYNNLVYPNPSQSFYNYYPSQSQAKYSYSSGPAITQPNEYDKVQTSITQSVSKEENGVNVPSADYNISPADANSAYKNAYTSRNSYSKL